MGNTGVELRVVVVHTLHENVRIHECFIMFEIVFTSTIRWCLYVKYAYFNTQCKYRVVVLLISWCVDDTLSRYVN